MTTKEYFIFVGMVALPIFIKYGLSLTTLISILVVAVLTSIPWYLGTRNRAAEPTRIERTLATLWAWFRRIVGVGVGALLLWAGWIIGGNNVLAHETMPSWLVGGGVAFMGFFCIYVGIVGQGWNRADWRDDVALHRDNKRRYKWCF